MAAAAPAALSASPAAASTQSARLLPQLESMGFPGIDVAAALELHADDGLSDAVSLERCMAFLLSPDSDRAKLSSAVSGLVAMGFAPRSRVISALTQSKGNAERAMERMLNEDEAAASRAREAERLCNPGGGSAGASAKPASSSALDAPLPPVTAQFSDDQVMADLLVHRAVFARDLRALGEYAKRKSNLLNTRDHRGRTPLLLAYALGDGWSDVVTFLLNRGADPRIKLPGGWSLLQQAALRRERALALDVHLHSTMLRQAEWDSSQARTIDALRLVRDFRLEIRWEVQSWIPLVGRLAPRDAFVVTKRGGDIRLDTKVVGMNGLAVIRGDLSYLFSRGTVWMLDREAGTVRDALAAFRNPAYDELEMHVDALCSADDKSATSRSEMRSHAVTFKERKTMWGRPKTSKVEGFHCREVVMAGLQFVDISLKDEAAAAQAAGAAVAGASASSSSASASPAPLASSSASSAPGALAHEVLTADSYFVPAELESYNVRRRIEAKVERRKRRRVRKAVVELQTAGAGAAAVASSSVAAAPAASAAVGAGAASSSSAAPDAAAACALAVAASSLAPLAASGSAPSSRRNSVVGSGSNVASSDDDDDSAEHDEATLSALPPAATPPADPSIVAKSTLVDATLCLSPDFPLPLSQLIVLLELLSPASSLLSKLRDILTVQLPLDPASRAPPFPVRITFPIFTQVNAAVTFAAFEPIDASSLPADTFEIPKEFRRMG